MPDPSPKLADNDQIPAFDPHRCIVRILCTQQSDTTSVQFITGIYESGSTPELNEPEFLPILFVMIDRESDFRVTLNVANPTQLRIGDLLRFLIEHADEHRFHMIKQRKADRHHGWEPFEANRRESPDTCVREAIQIIRTDQVRPA